MMEEFNPTNINAVHLNSDQSEKLEATLEQKIQRTVQAGRDYLMSNVADGCEACPIAKFGASEISGLAVRSACQIEYIGPHFKKVMADCQDGLRLAAMGSCDGRDKRICQHPHADAGSKTIIELVMNSFSDTVFKSNEAPNLA